MTDPFKVGSGSNVARPHDHSELETLDRRPNVPQATPTQAIEPTDGVDAIRQSVPLEGVRPEMKGIKNGDPRVEARREAQPRRWTLDPTGEAIIRHLQQQLGIDAATARRIVETPLPRLDRADVRRLTNKRMSPEAVEHLQQALEQVAGAMQAQGNARLAHTARAIAASLPGRVDAFGAKALYDLIQRLPKLHLRQRPDVDIRVPQIGTVEEEDGVRTRTFTFRDHSEQDLAITDGYYIYIGTHRPDVEPPAGTLPEGEQWLYTVRRHIDGSVPNSVGVHTYRFEDTDGLLDSDTMYFVWATAFNETGESGHSNILHDRFPLQATGDLNMDGVIDYADVEILARMIEDDPETAPKAADVDGSGSVTWEDWELLVQMATGGGS